MAVNVDEATKLFRPNFDDEGIDSDVHYTISSIDNVSPSSSRPLRRHELVHKYTMLSASVMDFSECWHEQLHIFQRNY